MHTLHKHRLSSVLVMCGFAFGFAACDSGTPAEDPKPNVVAKAKDGAKEAPTPKDSADKEKPAGDSGSNEAGEPGGEDNEDGAVDAEDLDPRVAKAAAIAKDIEANPEAADDVLAKHDLDREKLDALMYEIAKDPELSQAYQAARAG